MVNTEIRLIIFFAAKDGEAITAVMKLKECLLLGRKADKPRQHIKKQRHYFVDKGPSSQGYGFSNESTFPMRWSKNWSFSVSIIPSREHPGLISFRMDWLDLLAVQGTRKSLLQNHSSKASILWCSAFFTVQLSHPYMTTGKTIALTRRTFVGKVMSLLFNMLSRFVVTFLPKSKCLLFHGCRHHMQ